MAAAMKPTLLATLPQAYVLRTQDFVRKNMKFTDKNVCDNPFFFTQADKDLGDIPDCRMTDEQREFLDGKLADTDSDREDNYRFPLIVKTMYAVINNPKIAGQMKTVDGGTGMEIFSFEKVMDDYGVRKHVVPVGLAYHGMGWLIVLYMVKRTGKFFFGFDGGSNGYDQTFNNEFYVELNPKTQFSVHFADKKMYSFPEVLHVLRHKDWFEKANEMTPVANAVGHKKNESLSAVHLKVSEVEDA